MMAYNAVVEQRLLKLPEEIREKELQILTWQDDLAKRQRENAYVEYKVLSDIQKEKVGEKLKFTNKESRDTELKLRLDKDEYYQSIQAEVNNLEDKIKKEKIEIAYLYNLFTSLKYTIRMHTSKEEF